MNKKELILKEIFVQNGDLTKLKTYYTLMYNNLEYNNYEIL